MIICLELLFCLSPSNIKNTISEVLLLSFQRGENQMALHRVLRYFLLIFKKLGVKSQYDEFSAILP